jgi:cell division protein FtsA
MAAEAAERAMRKTRSGGGSNTLIGALDAGTSKVCCLIFACDPSGAFRLLGCGHQRMQGMKAGVVIDADQAERCVRAAVGQAESMAGATLDNVIIAATCGRLRSANFVARAAVTDRIVRRADVARVLGAGEAYAQRDGRLLVQLTRGDWSLDRLSGLSDPLGLAGSELALPMHVVTADELPLRHLLTVVERCYLSVESVVAAPYASALAVTTAEDRQLGVVCIDIGAGTTTVAAFTEGRFTFAAGLPVGGSHISYDIARELATPLAEAERIKTLYGSLVQAPSDEREVISFPTSDESEVSLYQTTREHLRSIIEPRMQSLFGLVMERLAGTTVQDLVSSRVVLTGGAAQLVGLAEWWSSRSGGKVRIGRPQPFGGISDSMRTPSFAAVAGLALAATSSSGVVSSTSRKARGSGVGYLGRVHQWFRESF